MLLVRLFDKIQVETSNDSNQNKIVVSFKGFQRSFNQKSKKGSKGSNFKQGSKGSLVHVSLIRNEIDFENEINSNRSFVESGVKFNNFKLSRNRSFTFVVFAIWSPSMILKIKSTTMQFIWYTVHWGPNFCPEKCWNDLSITYEICLVNALLVQTVRICTKNAHSNNL